MKMKSLISQIKIWIKNFTNRLYHVEEIISGLKCDKVDKLDYSDKDKEKIIKYKWDVQDLWDSMKRLNLWTTGIEEAAEVQRLQKQSILQTKIYQKRQRISFHIDKTNNPSTGYNNCKHIHTELQFT
jgi:hypothetical protein